jgi:hypothetical protein
VYIVVLNDGETFSDIKGCKIVWVNDKDSTEDIEEHLKDLRKADFHGDVEVVTTFK